MDLHVDDFDCVPDGRFLERVSMGAELAVLDVADGGLRPEDVGKSVAVPGAVDLITTIIGLKDMRIVVGAAMEAGSNLLTGTLTDPEQQDQPDGGAEPFLELHEGRRITVAGAGPDGSVLVTDVVHRFDSTTVELAEEASVDVVNVEVVLNDPVSVSLGTHARRTVTDLTVIVGDRTVEDAAVTIGGRGLGSESARFSSLDLGTQVTIQGAGLLVTTIESFVSASRVVLATPAQRAVDDTSADVWRTDSRPGLELLFGSLGALAVESGEIRFGPGVYDFRIPDVDDPPNAAIGLRGLRNLTLRGSGPGATVLRLMPAQDLSKSDTHVIETRDCHNLTLRDLSIHGAYLTLTNANEQMHGINFNEGSTDIVVERVRVFQSAGDGIRLVGRPENRVRRIWIDGCQLVQNKRTGVGFQHSVEFVWVRNCYIEMTPPSTDSCVDFEPTGTQAPTDVDIEANIMVHQSRGVAVSVSGISGLDRTTRVKLTNNIVLGGPVFCTDVAHLTIHDNLVITRDLQRNRIPVHVQRGGDGVLISGNVLVNGDTATPAVIRLSEVNNRPVRRARIANNICVTPAANGIWVESSEDVAIDGNTIVAVGPCTHGVLVHSGTTGLDNVSIRGNDITTDDDITTDATGSWETGVRINAPDEIRDLSVVDNSIARATDGIRFAGAGFRRTPVCALNRMADTVANPLAGVDQLPEKALVTGGAGSRGGSGLGAGRLLAGLVVRDDDAVQDPGVLGSPKVTGNIGDLFQRIDTENGGPVLFVKESGTATNTGWVAK